MRLLNNAAASTLAAVIFASSSFLPAPAEIVDRMPFQQVSSAMMFFCSLLFHPTEMSLTHSHIAGTNI